MAGKPMHKLNLKIRNPFCLFIFILIQNLLHKMARAITIFSLKVANLKSSMYGTLVRSFSLFLKILKYSKVHRLFPKALFDFSLTLVISFLITKIPIALKYRGNFYNCPISLFDFKTKSLKILD